MVFVSNEVGEHSITTRDLSVNENTIIQFEVLVLIKLLCFFTLGVLVVQVQLFGLFVQLL